MRGSRDIMTGTAAVLTVTLGSGALVVPLVALARPVLLVVVPLVAVAWPMLFAVALWPAANC